MNRCIVLFVLAWVCSLSLSAQVRAITTPRGVKPIAIMGVELDTKTYKIDAEDRVESLEVTQMEWNHDKKVGEQTARLFVGSNHANYILEVRELDGTQLIFSFNVPRRSINPRIYKQKDEVYVWRYFDNPDKTNRGESPVLVAAATSPDMKERYKEILDKSTLKGTKQGNIVVSGLDKLSCYHLVVCKPIFQTEK